jgi:hypothetical protein
VIQIGLTRPSKSESLQFRKHLFACIGLPRVGERDEADPIALPRRKIAVPLLAVNQGDLSVELRRLHPLTLKLPAQVVTHNKQERRTLALVIIVPL